MLSVYKAYLNLPDQTQLVGGTLASAAMASFYKHVEALTLTLGGLFRVLYRGTTIPSLPLLC